MHPPRPHIILIGHRGCGKTTLGAAAGALLGIPFIDVDDAISEEEGISTAEFVRRDEPGFRQREMETLLRLLNTPHQQLIAVGGGMPIAEAAERLTYGVPVAWILIDREGWDDVALNQRERLMPDVSFDEERHWMIKSRNPAYRATADTTLHIERGCGPEEAAQRLADAIGRIHVAIESSALANTWVLARSRKELRRTARLVQLFSFAGVEIRSDLETADIVPDVPYLASLRTDDDGFFIRHENATAFDFDIELIDRVRLKGLEPRTLVLSTHRSQPGEELIDGYRYLLHRISAMFPEWIGKLTFKYAPSVQSWQELSEAFATYRQVRAYADVVAGDTGRAAFLPQGGRWHWVRAMLLHDNALNYISMENGAVPPSLEFFLPYCGEGPFARHYAVIGDPVEHSIGAEWHMYQNRASGIPNVGYYNIRVTEDEPHDALRVLHAIGFKGLSVTSPLKRAVAASRLVSNPTGLEAGNTLTRISRGWALDDTDAKGMTAVLHILKARGIEQGMAAVYGSGGVSPAIIRALESEGWEVTPVAARDGWASHAEKEFTLVVNAAGPGSTAYDGAPFAKEWIDLHYRDTAPPPRGTEFYMSGMAFFEAQANAQRTIWGLE